MAEISFDKVTSVGLLYDYYGNLLPERQKQAVELYYEENLSLAEIAEEFDISRQGVHDALKKAERALEEYEEKLGLIKRFADTARAVRLIDEGLQKLIDENGGSGELAARLSEIKDIIDNIEY